MFILSESVNKEDVTDFDIDMEIIALSWMKYGM